MTKHKKGYAWTYLLIPAIVLGWTVSSVAQNYQGFGSETPGGLGKPFYYVTNLNDSGAGSLRDALSQGNRHVVFDVGGEIVLSSNLEVKGAFITIDGSTAPSPITLVNDGLRIAGDNGAHNIIVRDIRVRDAAGDSISIRGGAYNIVIDHVSSKGASDGGIDITRDAFNVTVQWSILAENDADHNFLSLVEYGARRVTFHHNLFVRGKTRNPQSGWDPARATTPPEIVTDIRNNLIWDFSAYGTVVTKNTKANVINNFYYSSSQSSANRALQVGAGARVYAQGNYSLNGANVDSQGNEAVPFSAAPVDTTDACVAAQQVVAGAGALPRDSVDQQYLAAISLPSCGGVNTPSLQANPNELSFSAVEGDTNPPAQTLSLAGSDGAKVSWTASSDAPWFSLSGLTGTTPSNVSASVSTSGLAAGTYLSTLTITAPAAENSPISVPLKLTVSPSPSSPPPQPPPSGSDPTIVSPNVGSVLPGSEVTFEWTANGVDVKRWRLNVGSNPGANDIYEGDTLGSGKTSKTISRLPTDGRTIWVQLRFRVSGDWQSADFQYRAALE